ncbi:hypothetical protein ACFFLM_08135 [Deinococcus oregonensis]|uniref:DUF1877 family protein n=1 Tax=Deinococcus oregonensis TaxID=1805970 RepID=A0ABV6AWY1_9DEIO
MLPAQGAHALTSGRLAMADRVGFMLGGSDGILSHFLVQPLQDFHAWYEEALQEFPDEFNATRWRFLGKILEQGPVALEDASPSDVNGLLLDYYGSYANFHGLIRELHDYWDKLSYHQLLVEVLEQQGHSVVTKLLTHTVMGRLTIADPSFPLNDWRDYELSYWTADEVITLKDALGKITEETLPSLMDDEMLLHAFQTTRETLDMAASQATGVIIFVGW